MAICTLCPRRCGIDRSVRTGFCGMGENAKIARAALHFWEEPCISGTRGSGTVFFSGCTLRCAFCQNWEISQQEAPTRELPPEALTMAARETGVRLVKGDALVVFDEVQQFPRAREAIKTLVADGRYARCGRTTRSSRTDVTLIRNERDSHRGRTATR